MAATADFERYCAEIVCQAGLLARCVRDANLSAPVPSCPGWTVGQLVRHVGGGQRWAAAMVAARSMTMLPDAHFRDLGRYTDDDPAQLSHWLTDSAAVLAGALRAAGPDSPVFTGPIPAGTAAFYARRFTHETAIHRADAELALGKEFTLQTAVALDGMDEWMELGSLPFHLDVHPRMRELLGPGRTLHFHATDTPGEGGEWLVDLTGDALAWRRGHEKAAVAVRGAVAELLLVVYRRRSPRAGTVEVLGDYELLEFWLDRVSFE